jgi:hypothetical protein
MVSSAIAEPLDPRVVVGAWELVVPAVDVSSSLEQARVRTDPIARATSTATVLVFLISSSFI